VASVLSCGCWSALVRFIIAVPSYLELPTAKRLKIFGLWTDDVTMNIENLVAAPDTEIRVLSRLPERDLAVNDSS
jgi:hypothetical protein